MTMKQIAFAETHGSDRVPMIGADGGDKFCPLGLPRLGKGLNDHLEAGLHGRGAVIGKENPVQFRRIFLSLEIREEFFSKPGGGLMGQAQKRGVSHFPKLGPDRVIELRVSVPVEIGPDGGVAVEVATPFSID